MSTEHRCTSARVSTLANERDSLRRENADLKARLKDVESGMAPLTVKADLEHPRTYSADTGGETVSAEQRLAALRERLLSNAVVEAIAGAEYRSDAAQLEFLDDVPRFEDALGHRDDYLRRARAALEAVSHLLFPEEEKR